MLRRATLVLALAVGCRTDERPGVDTPPKPTDGPGVPDPTPTGDTGTPPIKTGGPVTVSNLSWEVSAFMPSVIEVSWDQVNGGEVVFEYSFDKGVWQATPPTIYASGSNSRTIVGIPFETTAQWRVVTNTGTVEATGLDMTTGDLPSGLRVATVEVSDPTAWHQAGNYLLTSISDHGGGWTGGVYYTFIMDRQGRMVWAKRVPAQHWTLFASLAKDGTHFIWDESTKWSDGDHGAGSTLHRTYLDEEIEEISVPGLHHAWIERPDGTFVWGSKDHGGAEALVERMPGQVGETVLWTCEDDWSLGYCESNGLFYSAARDTYLYSFYTNHTLVEIDRLGGATRWWAGERGGGYDFVPSNSQFRWQHGVSWTDAGTILVTTEGSNFPVTTFVREYELNATTGDLTDIWNYDSTNYAQYNGQTWRLDSGNTLHIIGTSGHIREVDASGNTVWHVRMDINNDSPLLGQGEFIDDLYSLVAP